MWRVRACVRACVRAWVGRSHLPRRRTLETFGRGSGALRGETIEEDFTLSLPTGTVPRERWGDFAAILRRVDDAFLAGARVAR